MDIMEVRKAERYDSGGIVKDVGLNSEAFIGRQRFNHIVAPAILISLIFLLPLFKYI